MRTWEVVVKDMASGERYLLTVETETNLKAAAAVRALAQVYALPGMTWQSNLMVVTCMRTGRSGKAA